MGNKDKHGCFGGSRFAERESSRISTHKHKEDKKANKRERQWYIRQQTEAHPAASTCCCAFYGRGATWGEKRPPAWSSSGGSTLAERSEEKRRARMDAACFALVDRAPKRASREGKHARKRRIHKVHLCVSSSSHTSAEAKAAATRVALGAIFAATLEWL